MFRIRLRAGPSRPPTFVAFTHDRIVLHHPPAWPLAMSPARFVAAGVSDLIELAGWFGFPFSSPVHVWLFPTCGALSRFYHTPASGVAFVEQRAVAVGADAPDPVGVLRHELAHLVSASWGGMRPSLKCEGLAVWWQGRTDLRSATLNTSALCRERLRHGTLPTTEEMLDDVFFHNPCRQAVCYALAGSFAGWLIRRFGWVRYREFFRRAGPGNFVAAFDEVFGVPLDYADPRWRLELIPRRGLHGC